jgi:hypothetical protein
LFTADYVFGAQVSGTGFGVSLYQVQPVPGVDPLWSGGVFGPEASVVTVMLGFLVGAALLAAVKRLDVRTPNTGVHAPMRRP